MDRNWQAWNFETAPGGVSTAVQPDLLPNTQFSWGQNIDLRGAKPATRPNFSQRLVLPSGLYQGGGYFGVQNGMLVVSIGGNLFRLRIGARDFSFEQIPLAFKNSGIIKQVWMQQTIETLIIQDGQSAPIFYNGSVATRAGANQVPLGRMMAYGNGRLWVAVGLRQLVAGDIRTNTPGSELSFTETNYLSGGGALYFPRGITGLAFNAVTGTTDYGTLLVYSSNSLQSIRADITSRDQWQSYPGFVTNVLRTIGAAGQWGITEVNQDIYWRDASGGIRSLRSAVQDESGPGSAPISREVSRLVDYDSQQLLPWCSAIYFDNRLLMTSSPYLNIEGGISQKNLVSLDFAPISTMQGKQAPAYNGAWSGANWAQLFTGQFNGKQRAFGITSDSDGFNRLWEFSTRDRDDIFLACEAGAGSQPITAVLEYPRIDFGSPKDRKQLQRCDVWLSDVSDAVDLKAYWRSDNTQKWTEWNEVSVCATVEDASTSAPHTWKNLLPQQRPQIKSFTIPDGLDEITDYALQVGFQFQVRLVWTGSCRIQRTMLWSSPLDQTDYADLISADCVPNDVTGNEINYSIPTPGGCAFIEVQQGVENIEEGSTFDYGRITEANEDVTFTITNLGGEALDIGTISVTAGSNSGAAFSVLTQPAVTHLETNQSTTFVVRLSNATRGLFNALVAIPNSSPENPYDFFIRGEVAGYVSSLQWMSKSGNAFLIGYSEFSSPSTPPKKYRVQTQDGSFTDCNWNGPVCAGAYLTFGSATSYGAYTFDRITAAGTSAMYVQSRSDVSANACLPNGPVSGAPTLVAGPSITLPPTGSQGTNTSSPTFEEYVGNGNCVVLGSESGVNRGYRNLTLTVEDTEADALNRLDLANAYGAYGSSVLSGSVQPRVTGFNFNAQLCQYKAQFAGLPPLEAYSIEAKVYRRIYGSSDPFVLFETLVYPDQSTDSSGNMSFTNTTPVESGFEAQVQTVIAI